ncbi:ATP-binding protein, partial [Acinetobacter baumannii]
GRKGTFRINARLEGETVILTFQDDGAGMTEAVQRQAFDPFFTTRRGEGGTGLGLNIVVGFAGLLDLGYVGFYAVGAYTY